MEQRTQLRSRILANLGGNGVAQGLGVVQQLALVPLFLACWGTERYGDWLLVSALGAYVSWTDIGLATVASNEMSMLVARQDLDAARRVLHSTLSALAVGGALVFGGCGVLVWTQPIDRWLNLQVVDAAAAGWVVWCLVAYALLAFPGSLLQGVYRAYLETARGLTLANGLRLTELVVTAGCAAASESLFRLAAALVLTRLTWLLVLWADASRRFPRLRLGLSGAALREVRRLLRPALAFLAYPMGFAVILQGMTLLVGRQLGSAAVVTFTTIRTLTRVVVQLGNMVNLSFWPELSAAFGRRDVGLMARMYRRMLRATVVLGAGSAAAVILVGPALVDGWTGGVVRVTWKFLAVFAVGNALHLGWISGYIVLAAVNRHERISWLFLGGAVATWGLASAVTVPWAGILGVPTALLLFDAAMLIAASVATRRLLRDDPTAVGSLSPLDTAPPRVAPAR